MTITVLQSAQLCQEIYRQNPADWKDGHYWQYDDVIVAHRAIGDDDTLTFMGSKMAIDWMRDAAAAAPYWDSEIGFVPLGFWIGIDAVLAEVQGVITQPLTVQGHSLGGARARVAVAKMLCRNIPVKRLCVFGSPKAGFANMGRIFDKAGLDRASYRNRNDPVPLTPMTLQPLLPWAHSEPWQVMDEAGAPNDLDPLRDHHMAHYVAGAAKL